MNSKTLILTTAASMAWSGLALAQDAEEKKPQRPAAENPDRPPQGKGKGKGPGGGQAKGKGQGGGMAEVMKRLDKDGDGKITKEEAGENVWGRISRMDKNEDGAIGSDEIPQARPGGGRPGGGGGNPAEMVDRIFGAADQNGDGKITSDEAGERWERLSAADANEDDGVDKEEFTKMIRERMASGGGGKGGPGGGKGGAGQLFERADTDKDGKISKEEAGDRWQFLSRMDKNGDGAISKDEIPQRPGGGQGGPGAGKGGPGGGKGGGPTGMFDRFDKDKDGKLSKEEVPEEMWANLSRADDDADGRVSQEELEKVFSQRQGAGGKGKGKGKTDGAPGRPGGDKKPDA